MFAFVAIPLPLTGVWTGTCIALFIGMNKRDIMTSVILGNLVAGTIMTIISYFFADNTKYFSSAANNGYSGSLEVALINDTFRTTILGETVDSKGAYIENKDDTISDFALGFQIEGDEVGRRFWFYCVSATRPSTASQTIETSKEPVTETLNITASARITDGAIKCFMEKTSGNTTQYNGFFSNVYEKTPSA